MNKTKKISINQFEAVVNENFSDYIDAEWNGLTVTIKKTLSLGEMTAFVNSVAGSCFNEQNSYDPIAEDFAVRTAIVSLYTNLRLPSDISKSYDLLYKSDIVEFVCSYVNKSQLNAIYQTINKKINYNADTYITAAQKQFEDICSTLEAMQEQFSGIFDGIEAEDIKNLVVAVGEGRLGADEIVRAYIEHE